MPARSRYPWVEKIWPRRRVILHFPEQIAPEERDPQLKDKIARELAVIVCQLMQRFSDQNIASVAAEF
jgi:phage/plasmid-associated DNA primase